MTTGQAKNCFAVFAAFILSTLMSYGSARAISLGRRQPDGMICRELFGTPHDHHGRARDATRAEALSRALRHWSRFTIFEYGPEWGDWKIARRKDVKCEGGRGSWYCKVDGQPCKH